MSSSSASGGAHLSGGGRWLVVLSTLCVLAWGCGSPGAGEAGSASPEPAAASTTTVPVTQEKPDGAKDDAGQDTTKETVVGDDPKVPTGGVPTTQDTVVPDTAPTPTGGLGAPATCAWAGPTDNATLTYVADGQLREVVSAEEQRCLAAVGSSVSLSWAPNGNRALLEDGTVIDPSGPVATVGVGATAGWTWPTGLRFVRADGDRLIKVESDGSGVIDISFLDDHGAAVYHPDGMHLAVAGRGTAIAEWWDGTELVTEEWTQNGLFLVNNDGTGEQVWIDTVDARIDEVMFSADGTRLTFIADHGGMWHIHSFDLPELIFETNDGQRILSALPEDPMVLAPQYESPVRLHGAVIDPYQPERLAVAEGSCDAGSTVEVIDLTAGGYPTPVAADLNAVPVGFVGDSTLAILERDTDCRLPGVLWLVDLDSGQRTLIATGVEAASVRWVAPDLLLSLSDVIVAGFA